MPVHRGVDAKGSYYQWGAQRRYYYKIGNLKSRNEAKRLAELQGRAIEANKIR